MRKAVLHVEDRGELAYYLREYLKKNGYEVINAMDVEDANYFLTYEKDKIGYLIVDLNLPCGRSLESDDPDTHILAGWDWLRKALENNPEFTEKTIIFSAYIEQLKEKHGEVMEQFPGIELMEKQGKDDDPFPRLLDFLQNMDKEDK